MVTRSEWRRVLLFAVAVMLVTLVPYLVGFASQTPTLRYSGFTLGTDDAYSYIAKMRRGVLGVWDFYLFYTAEPHDSVPLVFLGYLLPGQAVGLFTDAQNPNLYTLLVVLYHALRVLSGIALILLIYRLLAHYLEAPGARFLALVLATLGGGLGWLLLLVGQVPPEFYIPEGFTFLSLLILPHLPLARAALLAGMLLLLASGQRRGLAVLAGLAWLVAGLIVPFYLAILYAILGIWGLMLWARDRAFPRDLFVRCLIAGGLTLPLFVYFLWAFTANPAFAQWSAQNSLPAPPPWHYLLAYAPYLLAGGFAVRAAWRQQGESSLLLLAWAFVGLVLVYLPISVQRRLAEGILIPLAILAVWGLNNRPWRGARIALLLATLPATLLLWLGAFTSTANQDPRLYMQADTLAALRWLDENAVEIERGAVVLSRFDLGNKLPAHTGLRPYVGHGPETLNSDEKREQARAFFDGDLSEREARALLRDETQSIDYVYVAAQDNPPAWLSAELTPVYGLDDIRIYALP